MQARDLMSRTVLTVQPSATIAEVVAKMTEHRVSGIPVVDDAGRIVGMITEGDLLRRAELGTVRTRPQWLTFLRGPAGSAEDFVMTNASRVGDVMSPDPVTAEESTPLETVVALMEKRRIRRVPIVQGETLVGIVSRSDLVRELGKLMPQPEKGRMSDSAILAALDTALRGQPWFDGSNVEVSVKDAVVHLSGTVFDSATRSALRVAAQNVAGVAAVDDGELTVVEPMTGTVV